MNESFEAKELFLKAKEGDRAAFDQIYELFTVPVYRYILLRTGHKQTCEDLTQSVFLKAYNSLPSYTDTGKPPLAWLFTIARNTIIDHFRKNSKVQIDSEDSLVNVASKENFVDKISLGQDVNTLMGLIKQLTEEQQEVITLKFISDLTNSEISTLLGKSEEAIRQLQSRGIKSLKKLTQDIK